jgi:hypothetical protein
MLGHLIVESPGGCIRLVRLPIHSAAVFLLSSIVNGLDQRSTNALASYVDTGEQV